MEEGETDSKSGERASEGLREAKLDSEGLVPSAGVLTQMLSTGPKGVRALAEVWVVGCCIGAATPIAERVVAGAAKW